MKHLFLLIVLSTLSLFLFAQDAPTASEINTLLGRGINMGNTFEAPTETDWNNPWKPEYFEDMANLGFDHVRIPISWETDGRSLPNPPYTITEDFMNRIVTVVDKALEVGLMPIINLHHHDEFMADPNGQKDRFLSFWRQIATRFKDYPSTLLFEVLNEPTEAVTPQLWNDIFADGLSAIRETNPTRVVLMGVAEFGGLSGVPKLVFPDDDYLILSIHYYNPFNFTHQGAEWSGEIAQGWLGTKWTGTEDEMDAVKNDFAQAIAISKSNNIPIHIGEFGAYNKADMLSRAKWTTFVARWFEEQGFSWAYWEYSAGFGIYNPYSGTYYQDLVDALLHNPMPDPIAVDKDLIYESNFEIDLGDWELSGSPSAEGEILNHDGKLVYNVTNGGSQNYDIQGMLRNISLNANTSYSVTVVAESESNRSITMYIGQDKDPWQAYSDYNNYDFTSTPSEITFGFKMGSIGDDMARMVFDLGNGTGDFKITSVKLYEIVSNSETDVLYESDFSGGMGNWGFYFAEGNATGNVHINDNNLVINVTSAGTESWHGQVMLSNLNLEANQKYEVEVSGYSPSSRGVTAYIGQDQAPYQAYSDYKYISYNNDVLKTTFDFTMGATSDPSARFVFDIGNESGEVIITSVKISKVIDTMVEANYNTNNDFKIWPNPVKTVLNIEGYEAAEEITIIDLGGRVIYNTTTNKSQVDMSNLESGIYILQINKGGSQYEFTKVIKY